MNRGWRCRSPCWCWLPWHSVSSDPDSHPSAGLPSPGFHHLHMNSANPQAAIDEFLTIYPASAKVTVAGFEGLRTANDVYMLFTKVSKVPPAPGPDRVTAKAPQTSFWHHVWAAADGRRVLESLRTRDPAFDRTRMIRQYTGPDGATVDFSSDTFPGFLTSAQVEAAKRDGAQPMHRGGYFNWYGPDGVVMETTDGPATLHHRGHVRGSSPTARCSGITSTSSQQTNRQARVAPPGEASRTSAARRRKARLRRKSIAGCPAISR